MLPGTRGGSGTIDANAEKLGNASEEIEATAAELRARIFRAVRDCLGDSILLSGGLDTGIVAAVVSAVLGAEQKRSFGAYTVVLDGAQAPDLEFSRLVSKKFDLAHRIHTVSLKELEKAFPEVIGVLRSFDPMEVRNSVPLYAGMKRARSDNMSRIMTGDASDELFAGYGFVFRLPPEKAKEALTHLWEVMHFSSVPLAASLGMEARLPFLHPAVKEFASSIDYSLLTGRRAGSDELFGKYVLRKAFEDLLPPELVWRTKTPIEHGSGTTVLSTWYSNSVRDSEFSDMKKKFFEEDGVRLRDKEQLRYYQVFRATLGPPAPGDPSRRRCPACTSNVPELATFCTTCGEYPI